MITVLRKPLITEKATKVGHLNQYVFEVAPDANKLQS
jgi:ribosomal protein L23